MNSVLQFVRNLGCGAMLATFVLVGGVATAQPFTEDFDTDVADWGDANSDFNPLTHVASGGADGNGYATTAVRLSVLGGGAGGNSAVLFRAQDEFGPSGSSGNAFAGNYLAQGIRQVSAFVRHDAPEPLSFFYRGSTAGNFPAVAVQSSELIEPNEWTEIVYQLGPGNPDLTVETFPGGPNYFAVMGAIGHLQLGVNIPASLSTYDTPLNFDIDQVSIATPEPSTLVMAGVAVVLGFRRRDRKVWT